MMIAKVQAENCKRRPSTGRTYENMEKVHTIVNDD
jgi:hypothetical protein